MTSEAWVVAFIKGFVEIVKVTGSKVLLTYSFPLLPKGETQEKIGVLPTVQYGGRYCMTGRTFLLTFSAK